MSIGIIGAGALVFNVARLLAKMLSMASKRSILPANSPAKFSGELVPGARVVSHSTIAIHQLH